MIPTKCPICKTVFQAKSNFSITCSVKCNTKNPKRLKAMRIGIKKRRRSYKGNGNPNWTGGTSIGHRLRLARDALNKSKRSLKKCERCKQKGKLGQTSLHIHHKDRNVNNNKAKNLEILCASCHFLEHGKKKKA